MSKPNNTALIANLKGCRCIFKRQNFIRQVRVKTVELFDWGARFSFETVPAAGFGSDGPANLTVTSCWEYLSISKKALFFAALAGWVLVTRTDLVEKIASFAGEATSEVDLRVHVNRLAFSSAGDEPGGVH